MLLLSFIVFHLYILCCAAICVIKKMNEWSLPIRGNAFVLQGIHRSSSWRLFIQYIRVWDGSGHYRLLQFVLGEFTYRKFSVVWFCDAFSRQKLIDSIEIPTAMLGFSTSLAEIKYFRFRRPYCYFRLSECSTMDILHSSAEKSIIIIKFDVDNNTVVILYKKQHKSWHQSNVSLVHL